MQGIETVLKDGVLVVDKESGWTSHDVVAKVRRIAKTKKVGHLGTLDPLATGVLPLVMGRATRLSQFFRTNEKRYRGVIHFGQSTDSYDADGAPTSPEVAVSLDRVELEGILERFRGVLMQTPPPISAKKIGGVAAYKRVRRQEQVEIPPVEVEVFRLELIDVSRNEATIDIHCTAGTYVRAIAHEAGAALGCGAFLKSLRRLESGDFSLEQARTIAELEKLAEEERLNEAIVPAAQAIPEFPAQYVDDKTAGRIRQGRDFIISPFRANAGARFVRAIARDGSLVAIGERVLPNLCHPVVVL